MGVSLGASAEILAVQLVEAGPAQAEFLCGRRCAQSAVAIFVQNMPDERGGQTFDQLQFFMQGRMSEADGFFALELMPVRASRAAAKRRPD